MFLFILVIYWNLLKNKREKFVEKLFVSNIRNTLKKSRNVLAREDASGDSGNEFDGFR